MMINRDRIKKKIRQKYYTKVVRKISAVCGKGLKVNNKSIVTKNTYLGNNVNFNGMRIAGGGKVVIGDNFHSGQECLIITANHDYDTGEAIPYGSKSIKKDVVIEDNVWLGDRVIILGGVTIREGAIIQAGSVVTKAVPRCGIAGGNPATVFKYRDVEHYEKLKKEGKFH